MYFSPSFISGLGLGGGLIMAIGAQNAHVLKAGLKRDHVGITVAVCVLVDALLISAGVAGVGAAVQTSPLLLGLARWGGAAFLLWYGLRSWRAVFASNALDVVPASSVIGSSRQTALLNVLALSLLNPHVYLDTVVLLGAIGGRFPVAERLGFGLGAVSASVLWFCSLGFGAHRLAHLFARPLAWKCIDALTGSTMLILSVLVAFAA